MNLWKVFIIEIHMFVYHMLSMLATKLGILSQRIRILLLTQDP